MLEISQNLPRSGYPNPMSGELKPGEQPLPQTTRANHLSTDISEEKMKSSDQSTSSSMTYGRILNNFHLPR